jgi:hypothetical protein
MNGKVRLDGVSLMCSQAGYAGRQLCALVAREGAPPSATRHEGAVSHLKCSDDDPTMFYA